MPNKTLQIKFSKYQFYILIASLCKGHIVISVWPFNITIITHALNTL